MAAAGWYPDPEGRPNHARYWDGCAWVGPAEGTPGGVPAPPVGPQKRRTILWLVIGAVVLIAGIGGVWSGVRDGLAEDPATARPTGSVWNEQPSAEGSAPPTPDASATSGGATVECPSAENVRAPHPADDDVHGGGLAMTVPAGWGAGTGWSSVLTDEAGASRNYKQSGWASFVSVGFADRADGFTTIEVAAAQVLECHVSSGRFTGYAGHTIELSAADSVEGQPAWRIVAHAASSSIPGGSASFVVTVVDTGDPSGFGVFWAGIVDADDDAAATLGTVQESLRLSS